MPVPSDPAGVYRKNVCHLEEVRLHILMQANDEGSIRSGAAFGGNRGLKIAQDKTFTVATNVKVYFCGCRTAKLRRSAIDRGE